MYSTTTKTRFEIDLPHRRGKVRDIYNLGDQLLLVASDRISVFDWVLPTPIPGKGYVLNQLSAFWFNKLDQYNHMITIDNKKIAEAVAKAQGAPLETSLFAQIVNRSMLVRKASVLPIECIIRGYLAGSGWQEYQQNGTVCGIKLPPGLKEADKLPKPIFTPSTKNTAGRHNKNITADQMVSIISDFLESTPRGKKITDLVISRSLSLYQQAADYTFAKGIIIADTKFEWGLINGNLTLIDETLTPDSSHFWPADQYQPGQSQPSFDKQFVRDYVTSTGWNKESEPPTLPPRVIEQTRAKYFKAYKQITE